ncbi:uroporphyrinogen-III synthase [Agrobacterium tumefaciens]|uniref:uroporphyrinogen-III synthase n=1 Tax=Agrobacterium tumefaciens TaxID=358 RepID=UPI0021D0F7CB|nr:uroporphyrinogen-III synthase [Agrobacterium tumefaciens]UXS02520.1 uroporphyrinogen-III synthase [Agrobacterium tumefaciens]
MRIVVTRPERSGKKTAAKLKALGHDPVPLPLFHPIHYGDLAGAALAAPKSALAVTSAEAIRALKPLGTSLTPYFTKPIFAVGEATADAARQAGFQNIFTAAGDGKSLATLVVENRALLSRSAPLLYLAGTPRAPSFEAGLQSAAIAFTVAECYEMRENDFLPDVWDAALVSAKVDVILLYSAEATQAFFRIATKPPYASALAGTRFICMSENVKAHIPDAFSAQTRTAATPSEATMLEILHAIAGT